MNIKSLLLDIQSCFKKTLSVGSVQHDNLDTSVFPNQNVSHFLSLESILVYLSSQPNNICEEIYWELGAQGRGKICQRIPYSLGHRYSSAFWTCCLEFEIKGWGSGTLWKHLHQNLLFQFIFSHRLTPLVHIYFPLPFAIFFPNFPKYILYSF